MSSWPTMTCDQRRGVWPVAGAVILLAAAEVPAAVHLLSAGQAFSQADYSAPAVTLDGDRVVYCQDAETDGRYELWSVPLAGGAPLRISRPLPAQGFACEFRISPDGSTVVYEEVHANLSGSSSLLVTAVDGSTVPFPLTPTANAIRFAISPDGTTVVYLGDHEVSDHPEVYAVPIVGGKPAKINGPLVAGGEVTDLAISSDSAYVVYRADQSEDERFALYGAAIAGGGTWWPISLTLPTNDFDENVLEFAITPSGWVVYLQELYQDETYELFSHPFASAGAYTLNDPLAKEGDVHAFQLSPDGSRAVYVADQNMSGQDELYSVPVEDGAVVKLSGPFGDQGNVLRDFLISPDGSRVVYVADEEDRGRYELYSVPIGGGTRVRLQDLDDSSIVFERLVSPDSSRVVYSIFHGTGLGPVELYSVPVAGGTPAMLSPVLPNGVWAVHRAAPSGDGAHVFFEFQSFPDAPATSTTTLYRVPLAGGEILSAGPTLALAAGERFEWTGPALDPRQILFVAHPGAVPETELYLGDICVFCDGFESGETVRWSAVVP